MDLTVRKLKEILTRPEILGKDIPLFIKSSKDVIYVYIDNDDVFIGLDKIALIHHHFTGHGIDVGVMARKKRGGYVGSDGKIHQHYVENLVFRVMKKATQP